MAQRTRLSWISGLSLDMKLGGRMLAKYPGITLVGGIAMAFAIWFGTVTFELVGLFAFPKLPLPDGDRIVQIYNWDTKQSAPEKHASHDFLTWRSELRAITEIGAYHETTWNLSVPGGPTTTVKAAEMTASGFVLSSARPVMGRVFETNDERSDAAPVVVISWKTWRDHFNSDGGIVGKSVRLGDSFATVIGVMKEGYAFPVSHDVWTPLHVDRLDRTPRAGMAISVFGKLANGMSLQKAQSELDIIGRRMSVGFRETHEFLKPRVASYVASDNPSGDTFQMTVAINLMVAALLVLICGNVALLLFARAATRETELTVRSALGASRSRIVMQLFSEALVLGAVSAAVGLGAAALTLGLYGMQYLEMNLGRLPFWFDTDLSPMTVGYAIALTIFGAVIAGVLPALKVTKGISAKLRQSTAGSGLKFGGVWTFVIVAQVAATVLLPAIVLFEQNELSRIKTFDVGFAAREYLAVNLQTDTPVDTSAAALEQTRVRTAAAFAMIKERVANEAGVLGATFVSDLPAAAHGGARIQLADSVAIPGGLRYVNTASADVNYFSTLNAKMLAGRDFQPGDYRNGARNVIVDIGFVKNVLGGANPLGRRIRVGKDDPQWYEIVGVVKDLGMGSPVERSLPAGMYLPVNPERMSQTYLLIHSSGDPLAFSTRLRAISESVDPSVKLNAFTRVDTLSDPLVWFITLWRRITMILTGIAVLLSLAGIYAVLSFTVSKRTREIGIRVAVGASPKRIVATIFKRPLTQVGIGIGVGATMVGLGSIFVRNHQPDTSIGLHTLAGGLSLAHSAALLGYAALMLGVCLLACIVPTRRALGIQPTEALRAE